MGTYWMEDLTGFVKNEGFIQKGLTLLSCGDVCNCEGKNG